MLGLPEDAKHKRLVELCAIEQANNIRQHKAVKAAGDIQVHAVLFDLGTGLLTLLD